MLDVSHDQLKLAWRMLVLAY